MASITETHGHSPRSPSPVTRPRRQTQERKLLGNFRPLYKQFPELSLGGQELHLGGVSRPHSATEGIRKEKVKPNVPPANCIISLPHSVWESPPATPAQSIPKLGRLDKLERLGILHTGNNKPSPSQPHNNGTSQGRGELKAQLQSPLHTSSCSTRLQRAYGLSIHNLAGRDTSSTIVEQESPIDADDGSANELASKATTPATSPDFTFELQAKIDAIVDNSTAPSTSRDIQVTVATGLWPEANRAHAQQGRVLQVSQLPPGLFPSGPLSYLLHFQKKAQQYRANIFALMFTYSAILQAGSTASLPWDEYGNYNITETPIHQKFGISFGNKSSCIIEPHYRVDKATQLSIVKVRLAQMEIKRQLEQANSTAAQSEKPVMIVHPSLIYKSTQPVHVFVDMSNIVIGFCQYI